jgi:type IV secretory pathway TrbL component
VKGKCPRPLDDGGLASNYILLNFFWFVNFLWNLFSYLIFSIDIGIYKYSSNIYFKSSLTSKLKMIDVNFSYNTDELNNLEIHYDIEYHPINKKIIDEN